MRKEVPVSPPVTNRSVVLPDIWPCKFEIHSYTSLGPFYSLTKYGFPTSCAVCSGPVWPHGRLYPVLFKREDNLPIDTTRKCFEKKHCDSVKQLLKCASLLQLDIQFFQEEVCLVGTLCVQLEPLAFLKQPTIGSNNTVLRQSCGWKYICNLPCILRHIPRQVTKWGICVGFHHHSPELCQEDGFQRDHHYRFCLIRNGNYGRLRKLLKAKW